MSGQTVYRDQLKGFAGQRVGMGHSAKTGKNDTGAVRQVHSITVSAAVDSTTYTFTVDVGGGPVAVSIVSGVGATLASIRDQLLAAARANSAFEDAVSFNPSGAASIRITSTKLGVPFTAAESDANLTNAVVTANVAQQAIPFGRGVVWRPGGQADSIALPSAGGQVFQGVLERIHSVVDPSNADNDPAALSGLQAGTVIHKGQVIVEIEAVTVDPSAGVFLRHTSGAGGTVVGRFRIDADTATADAVANAKWADVFTGPGLAVLSLDLP